MDKVDSVTQKDMTSLFQVNAVGPLMVTKVKQKSSHTYNLYSTFLDVTERLTVLRLPGSSQTKDLLFISYKSVKGFFVITFSFLLISR